MGLSLGVTHTLRTIMQTQITATVHLYFQTPTPQDAAVVEISTIYEKKKKILPLSLALLKSLLPIKYLY